jgi:hypothetical protein
MFQNSSSFTGCFPEIYFAAVTVVAMEMREKLW